MFCPVCVSGSRCGGGGGGGRRKTLLLRLKVAAGAGSPEAVRPSGLQDRRRSNAQRGTVTSHRVRLTPERRGSADLLRFPRTGGFTVPGCIRCGFQTRPTYRATACEERETWRAPQEVVLWHQHTTRLSAVVFDISKEMQRRCNKTKQKAKEKKTNKQNGNERKTKRGLQAQQQDPGPD